MLTNYEIRAEKYWQKFLRKQEKQYCKQMKDDFKRGYCFWEPKPKCSIQKLAELLQEEFNPEAIPF